MKRLEQQFRAARNAFRIAGLRGFFYTIKSIVTKSECIITVAPKNLKHPLHLRVYSSDIPTHKKVLVNQEYDFQVESPPEVIVDAGANIGLATVYFANKFPDAKIIAIEPEKENFRILQMNVERYKNVVAINAALWNGNGRINLFDPGLGSWGFATESAGATDTQPAVFSQAVESMTLDRLIANWSLKMIDILKVDIEGAEKEVFEGSPAWIGNVRSVIIELHEHLKPGCDRSFFTGTPGFDNEWRQGENLYLTKGNYLLKGARNKSKVRRRL